jgi:hypothetical protein
VPGRIVVLATLQLASAVEASIKEGKFFTYVLGVLVNLVEPNSGMELVKATFIDQEAGSEVWDDGQEKYVTLD